MVAVRRVAVWLTFGLVGLALCIGGCADSEESEETVYMHIINGYPGSDSLTLYGPNGRLVSGLGFSERTQEPVEVDRSTNSEDFTLLIDGAPTSIELTRSTFSLYPRETGTLVINRRSGESAAQTSLYRHTRSPDPDCVLTMGNSLSLDDEMTTELQSYAYQTEWKISPDPYYNEDEERLAETRCGPVEVPDDYRRPELHEQVRNDPWLFPVESETESDLGYSFAWAERRPDPRTDQPRSEGIRANGQIVAEQHTEDYTECLSDSVELKQDEEEQETDAEPECPDLTETAEGPDGDEVPVLDPDEVDWDDRAAGDCGDSVYYTGFPVEPGQPDSYVSFEIHPQTLADDADSATCSVPVRVRTPTTDLIFQDADENVDGYIQSEDDQGGFVEAEVGFDDVSQHRFFVLYGRPVNPFVEQWDSERHSVDLDEHPYPGEVSPYSDGDDN